MEQQKNNYSHSSTAESDHKNQTEKSNDDGGAARSYDCAFCKRGFTNAQALGGHMNIHRKDKAKAKKKTKQRNHEDPSIYSQITTATANYNDESFGEHMNYRVYMPSLQGGNYEYCFFPIWKPDNLEDRMNGNLSLRMGSGEDEEDGVDLELRLGRLL